MWHILDLRWQTRWGPALALSVLAWTLGLLASALSDLPVDPGFWLGLSLLGAIGGVWFYLIVLSSLDVRESRPVLHLTVPLSLHQVAIARIAEPLAPGLIVLAVSLVGAWAAGEIQGLPTFSSNSLVIGSTLLMLLLQQINFILEELQIRSVGAKGRSRVAFWLGSGLAGAVLGGLVAASASEQGTVGLLMLARPSSSVALASLTVLLATASYRLFVRRADFTASTCGW